MTLIDHRVLISAPPEVVWELVGNLSALPKWHINCTQTSILTTHEQGVGVRRRNTMRSGPDVVEEILTWYNNLGFEYTVVDGPNYRSNRGFIRLQVIPEGTVIQWTFEYVPGGFLAGLRDFFIRRRLNNEVLRSLKRLKQLVESTGIRFDTATRDRVSMRPAPNAAERAAIAEALSKTRASSPPVAVPSSEPSEAPAAPEPDPTEAVSQETVASTPPDLAADMLPSENVVPADAGLLALEGRAELPEMPVTPEDDDLLPFDDDIPALVEESPLTDEDTRPRPATTDVVGMEKLTPEEARAAEAVPEDSTLAEAEAATKPAIELEPEPEDKDIEDEIALSPAPESEPDFLAFDLEPALDFEAADDALPAEDTAPAPLDEPAAEPESAVPIPDDVLVEESPVDVAQTVDPPQPAESLREPDSASPEPEPSPSSGTEDVGPSIWEVFGLTPPSQADAPAEAELPPSPNGEAQPDEVAPPPDSTPSDIRATVEQAGLPPQRETRPIAVGRDIQRLRGAARRIRRQNAIRAKARKRSDGLRRQLARIRSRKLRG